MISLAPLKSLNCTLVPFIPVGLLPFFSRLTDHHCDGLTAIRCDGLTAITSFPPQGRWFIYFHWNWWLCWFQIVRIFLISDCLLIRKLSFQSSGIRTGMLPIHVQFNTRQLFSQPILKTYRKWCFKFRTTPLVRTGFPAVIQHWLSKIKKLKRSNFGHLFFLGRRMRSAVNRVEQSWGYWYLSKMEWFSFRPQQFYA